MDYTHSHPSTLLATLVSRNFRRCINPPYTFLKTTTIPTYYGISIAIPRYIVMQLPPLPFDDLSIHCHIPLHDHVVDIVFVTKPAFIILSYMSLLIHFTSRYTAGDIHI